MSRLSALAAQADDRRTELVKVPEWGCDIGLRTMDGHARSHYLTRFIEAQDADDPSVRGQVELELIIACAYDPDDLSGPAFGDDDIPMLMTKSGAVIGRLGAAAMRVNALDADSEARLGKDSSDSEPTPTPNDASTSTSPAN